MFNSFLPNILANKFTGDGKLAREDGSLNSQILILGVVIAAISVILAIFCIYYLVRFVKRPAKEKIYGKPMLYMVLGLTIVTFICWILVLVFFSKARAIFNDDADKAFSACVALIVIGFIFMVAEMAMLMFGYQYFLVSFDDEEINFYGEGIAYAKITRIIKDTNTGNVYINYQSGKRNHKKLKFRTTSVMGQFILQNAVLTGHDVVNESQKEYSKVVNENDRVQEDIHEAEVSRKVKERAEAKKLDKKIEQSVKKDDEVKEVKNEQVVDHKITKDEDKASETIVKEVDEKPKSTSKKASTKSSTSTKKPSIKSSSTTKKKPSTKSSNSTEKSTVKKSEDKPNK